MVLKGIVAYEGIVLAKAIKHNPIKINIDKQKISSSNINATIDSLYLAIDKAKAQVSRIINNSKEQEKREILSAHLEILNDDVIIEEIVKEIKEDLKNCQWAIDYVLTKYENLLGECEDLLISERANDVKDVKSRLLRCFYKEDISSSEITDKVILFAEDLLTSEMALIDKDTVVGIVLEKGGLTSHTVILAKLFNIPTIISTNMAMSINNGDNVILDAFKGEVYVNASKFTEEYYAKQKKEYDNDTEKSKEYMDKKAVSQDGQFIEICLNVNLGQPSEFDCKEAVNGIGLFRTEFLFMSQSKMPSEEKQFNVYKEMLSSYANKPVTIRTLDIGGDKQLDYLPLEKEDNPFLGNRALRLCFKYPQVFRTQIRALLRASSYGNLQIMLPMVTNIEDITRAKEFINGVEYELIQEGHQLGDYKLGVMIEIPSIAMMSDIVAKQVDFASIGSNDLTQYTTAADRLNQNVNHYYNYLNIGVLRMLKKVIQGFNEYKTPISICGEMASQKVGLAILLGLGIKKISISKTNVAKAKRFITEQNIERLQLEINKILDLSTEKDVETIINKYLEG